MSTKKATSLFCSFTIIIVAVTLFTAFLLLLASTPTTAAASPSTAPAAQAEDQEYCCCSSQELDENAGPLLFDVLDPLVQLPYFRYFHVNVKKKCPYWVVHLLCMQRGNPCKCGRCEKEEVPESLRTGSDMGKPYDFDEDNDDGGGDDAAEVMLMKQQEQEHQQNTKDDPALDRQDATTFSGAVSELDGKKLKQRQQQQKSSNGDSGSSAGMTTTNDEIVDPNAEYIDLVRNPEANTMYLGDKAVRVWRAIYDENCFKVGDDESGQCREKRVFYRLISGLHTSISTHIAAYYKFNPPPTTMSKDAETPEQRHMRRSYAEPNCTTFKQRLTSKPQHVDNLHFLYRFVIRALTRSRTAFVDPDNNFEMRPALKIGDPIVDGEMQRLLAKLFKAHLLCSPTFNESKLLEQPDVVALVPLMKKMIRNMTTIMDCISCEKCRTWGKLQLTGLATAFKIITLDVAKSSSSSSSPSSSGDAVVPQLDRREMMSLVNLARQLTDSVHNVKNLCGGASPAAAAKNAEKKDVNRDL